MSDHTERKCSKCGQRLRVPTNLGGMLMACPACGNRLHSDFKFACPPANTTQNRLQRIFGLPWEIISRMGRYFFS